MLYTFYPLIASLLSNVIAQLLKPVTKYVKTKTWDPYQILAAGGFPSSHASTMSAMTLSLGFKDGFDSSVFFLALALTGIIMYDAMNVRLYAGKHIALTQKLINDLKNLQTLKLDDPIYLTKLKEILGHERIEVFGGFILGIIVSTCLFIFINGGL
ncbi:divergent PAP2 family protein [Mycoplasma sp. P36-A1]|uniref:divergent PAP2 family protein n=1 Tax=Mycoplasma sp. P36-A1 TaxID=3252900 RepID=UPI003C2E601F